MRQFLPQHSLTAWCDASKEKAVGAPPWGHDLGGESVGDCTEEVR